MVRASADGDGPGASISAAEHRPRGRCRASRRHTRGCDSRGRSAWAEGARLRGADARDRVADGAAGRRGQASAAVHRRRSPGRLRRPAGALCGDTAGRGVSALAPSSRSHPGSRGTVRAYLVQPWCRASDTSLRSWRTPRRRGRGTFSSRSSSTWSAARTTWSGSMRRRRTGGSTTAAWATSTSRRRCCAITTGASSSTSRCSCRSTRGSLRPVLARIAPRRHGAVPRSRGPCSLDFASNLHKDGLDRWLSRRSWRRRTARLEPADHRATRCAATSPATSCSGR